MINSLFSLAKASSGNVELHKETFELNRPMEQIFADMDDRIKRKRTEICNQFTEEDTAIYSDNSYFYRIHPESDRKCAGSIRRKEPGYFVKTYKKEGETDQKIVLRLRIHPAMRWILKRRYHRTVFKRRQGKNQ